MGADLSRVRFDALRDHRGVVMQQGRLLLDADWNELVAIMDRRLRADAADLGSAGPQPGIAGVAVVPRTTPDAFTITPAGADLTIGRGRMYVDGLLAENHGRPPATFDALLSEPVGSTDPTYSAQPYWPTPTALPASGTHLVYLDVWTREVTALEQPDLVEPAVGVDTTARTQTVWQVRVHAPDTPGISCATPDADISGWPAVIASSAGRITTDTIPVTDADDPCALPPTGGYRGLENQAYRVEIHNGGAPGTATFKWSRDNASVASAVVEVPSGTTIRPASLGKDGVLRFNTGNWVEITDDHREFNQQPGEIRKVEVHEENDTLTFTPPLPADLVMTPAQATARHLRVRRWDQHGQVKSATGTNLDNLDAPGSPGVIVVPTGGVGVVLESGLTVALTAPGGVFRTGDHWIFAARTSDSSVEKLVLAPPLGVHHHYARLGVATFPGTITPCRVLWPPDCECEGAGGCGDCTVCVTPESHASGAMTIQAAVDEVTATGGTVCLAVGTYNLDAPVTITDANSITVRGQGPQTLLVARGAGVAVTTSVAVTLEDFALIGRESSLITATTTAEFTTRRLTLVLVAADDAPIAAIELAGMALLTSLQDNLVSAPIGIRGGEREETLSTAGLDIKGNALICAGSGIWFEGRVAHLMRNAITDNLISGSTISALHAVGVVGPAATLSITGNWITTESVGIEVGGSGATVAHNQVSGTEGSGDGIAVVPNLFPSLHGFTRISDNQVRDVGGVGIAVSAEVADLAVHHNNVERAAQGIVMALSARAATVTISDNVVRDVGALESRGGVGGILVAGSERADIESNNVFGVGAARSARDGTFGIGVLGCAQTRVAGNAVDRVGFDEAPGRALGIAVVGFGAADVHGNTSRRSDIDVDKDVPSEWIGLLVGTPTPPDRRLEIGGLLAVRTDSGAYVLSDRGVLAEGLNDGEASVSDNSATGGGEMPAMLIAVTGNAVVSANRATQMRDSRASTVQVEAAAATIATNVAVGGRPSMDLMVDPERVAVLGNLTSGEIIVKGAPLAAPWDPLNPIGVV